MLHARLVRYLNELVQRGELTERGMAQRAGMSQPHLHNVLKGKRLLSWQSADGLLREIDVDLADLVKPEPAPSGKPPKGYSW